jgi:hypothetical protein
VFSRTWCKNPEISWLRQHAHECVLGQRTGRSSMFAIGSEPVWARTLCLCGWTIAGPRPDLDSLRTQHRIPTRGWSGLPALASAATASATAAIAIAAAEA